MEDWEKKLHDEAEEFARTFSKFVNRMGNNKEEVIRRMVNDHPTLQQNYMRFFIEFCQEMAKKEYTDARNEASVKLAREILKLNTGLPYV